MYEVLGSTTEHSKHKLRLPSSDQLGKKGQGARPSSKYNTASCIKGKLATERLGTRGLSRTGGGLVLGWFDLLEQSIQQVTSWTAVNRLEGLVWFEIEGANSCFTVFKGW